jgi:catechol 2,3-dioxygenase-like lactoylglutathione lyase family enzyme
LNPYGHVDMRVKALATAMPFYEKLLPALGFDRTYHTDHVKAWVAPGELPAAAAFALTEEADHVPNANRLAFWAPDRAAVDRLAAIVREAGGLEVDGPLDMPHGPVYYAVYFNDPSGNRLEIYHRMMG